MYQKQSPICYLQSPIFSVKAHLTETERLAQLNQLFGAWQDQTDLIDIFADLDQQRHSYHGRVIDSMNE
ncbi:MAG: hypothetical protein ACRAVC_08025 [Trichormus sp.]